VIERITRRREEKGESPQDAAAGGARDVAGALVASTLTTCVVFLPVVFTQTTTGALFRSLALVVVFAQACSLLVALTLVPMQAARFLRPQPPAAAVQPRRFLQRLESWYMRRLQGAIHRRGRVFLVTGALVVLAALFWPLIPVELAPQTDADEIELEVEMAQGTSIAVVREYVRELENHIRGILPAENVTAVATEVRGSDADIEIQLVPEDRRSQASSEMADALRAAVDGRIPGAEISVEAQPGLGILRRVFSSGGGEDAVELEIRGWDLEQADALAAEVRRRIERVDGITDVRVRRREGRPVSNLRLDRARIAALGLSIEDVARTVQANVGGVEAGRLREGGEEYPIVVRLRPGDRVTGQDLHNVALRAPDGSMVALSSLVVPAAARTPVSIQRVDGQRVTYVTAGLARGVALGDAVGRVRDALAELPTPQGFAVLIGGEYQEQMRARRDFVIAIVLALVLVYLLMAAQFEHWIDPLIIMLAVPVALVGVVPALLLTGTTLNLQSVMGLVMLVGIVVNNAIVLVDAVNLLRREHGMGVLDAVVEAGRERLRPILMTTATTVLGLVPLALGIGPGAEIQAALARVVIGGLVASTLVTLFLIPVAYVTTAGLAVRVRERGATSRGRRRVLGSAQARQ
jgi:HAE1 family hydrophobic/amphiphilic exporter-1